MDRAPRPDTPRDPKSGPSGDISYFIFASAFDGGSQNTDKVRTGRETKLTSAQSIRKRAASAAIEDSPPAGLRKRKGGYEGRLAAVYAHTPRENILKSEQKAPRD